MIYFLKYNNNKLLGEFLNEPEFGLFYYTELLKQPVITEEDGKKVQQAEIEVNEIIFRLEVTEKLEKLAKEGTDEAALEAGKLLTEEILHNTHDNTGLIKETV